MPKKAAPSNDAPASDQKKKTKTGPTPAEKLADELDDLMIAYLKACREISASCGGFTPSTRVVSARAGGGWSVFPSRETTMLHAGETPDKAPALEKKLKAKTAQLAALQDTSIDAHPSWADVE